MGKSGHIARKVAATLASTGTPAFFMHPAEASHGDLGMVTAGDVVLAFSWSGETPELRDVIHYCKRFAVTLIAVASGPKSALIKAASLAFVLPAAEEACPNRLAPTTSTTMQLAFGDALAMALLEARGFSARDFHAFHPGGKLGAQLITVGDLMGKGEAVPRVGEAATIAEAIAEITAKAWYGGTAVVDGAGRLVGRAHRRRPAPGAGPRQPRLAGGRPYDPRAGQRRAGPAGQRGHPDHERARAAVHAAVRLRGRQAGRAPCTCTTS